MSEEEEHIHLARKIWEEEQGLMDDDEIEELWG